MISDSLTSERVRLPDGTYACRYPWRGETVLVRDGAMDAMRCIAALTDSGATGEGRRDAFLAAFLPDVADAACACDWDAEAFAEFIDSAVWDVLGLDLRGTRAHEDPVWDLEEDAARIRASFRQAYGIDWDEERGRISFAEFIALVGGCPEDTPLGRAIHYRTRSTRPKPTKHNRREVERWDALHRAYALHCTGGSHGASGGDGAMRDVFSALKRAAR